LGNGSIELDSISRPREIGQPSVDRMIKNSFFELQAEPQDLARADRSGPCGAMAQQCGDSGYQSAPQKFIHLVGCRDTSVCTDPANRPDSPKR
jgi:hypothetical protein